MKEQSTDQSLSNSQSASVKPPRVWTVFAALGLALFFSTLLQAGLGAILAITELRRGVKPEELSEAVLESLNSPYVFILMIACLLARYRETRVISHYASIARRR